MNKNGGGHDFEVHEELNEPFKRDFIPSSMISSSLENTEDMKGFSLQEAYAKIGGFGRYFCLINAFREISPVRKLDDDIRIWQRSVHHSAAGIS
jgi:hypothetical protein